jgi:hypothetical protein
MSRLEKLQDELNTHGWPEIARIKNQIRKNTSTINQLMRENLFELDVNANDQKVLLKFKKSEKRAQKVLQNSKEIKKIKTL